MRDFFLHLSLQRSLCFWGNCTNKTQAEHIVHKTRDIPQKTRDISQKTKDFFQKTKDFFQKTKDIFQKTTDVFQKIKEAMKADCNFRHSVTDVTAKNIKL